MISSTSSLLVMAPSCSLIRSSLRRVASGKLVSVRIFAETAAIDSKQSGSICSLTPSLSLTLRGLSLFHELGDILHLAIIARSRLLLHLGAFA